MANGQSLLGLQENLSNMIFFFALQFMFKNKRNIVTNFEVCDLSTRLSTSVLGNCKGRYLQRFIR